MDSHQEAADQAIKSSIDGFLAEIKRRILSGEIEAQEKDYGCSRGYGVNIGIGHGEYAITARFSIKADTKPVPFA